MRLLVPAAMLLASLAALTLANTRAAAEPVRAEAAVAFVPAEARTVVETLADTLERDYMEPDAGKAYAAALRGGLAASRYDRFASARAFAEAVTADLQAVHPDAHLNLLLPRVGEGGEREAMSDYPTTSTISARGWVAPGIAYVSFSAFFANKATLDELRSFLREVRGATTLILDLRRHMGGEFAEMDMIFGQLFARRTALLDMDTREAVFRRNEGAKEEGPTIVRIAGPTGIVRQRHWAVPAKDAGLTRAKVYVLTSKRTASVAEHFALALKRSGRATLVGETTRGAGNYGDFANLGHGYSILVPDGRTFDPDTGRGWEGTGIAPNIAVPADGALAEVIRREGLTVDADASLAALAKPKVASN